MTRSTRTLVAAAAASAVAAFYSLALAEWTPNGLNLTPVEGDQYAVDMDGGWIVWMDSREGRDSTDVFIDRVSAGGVRLYAATNGFDLTPYPGEQFATAVVANPTHGVFWNDGRRFRDHDVYYHSFRDRPDKGATSRLTDELSPVIRSGPFATAPNRFRDAQVTFAAWLDYRPGGNTLSVQRATRGDLTEHWTNALRLGPSPDPIEAVVGVVGDEDRGAFVLWREASDAGSTSLRYQRVFDAPDEALGLFDPTFPPGGRLLARRPIHTPSLAVAPGMDGDFFVAWLELEGAGPRALLRVHHVRSDGQVDPLWSENGYSTPVGFEFSTKTALLATSDGGCAVGRIGRPDEAPGLYVHRIDPEGGPTWLWHYGVRASHEQPFAFELAEFEHDRLLAVWSEGAEEPMRIRAQRLELDARVSPSWPAGGALLTPEDRPRLLTKVSADDAYALVLWTENSGPPHFQDVVVQYVNSVGRTGYGGEPRIRCSEEPEVRIAPNPVRVGTTICMGLDYQHDAQRVTLIDAAGRVAYEWPRPDYGYDYSDLEWDGTRASGAPATAGVYWLRIDFTDRPVTKRIVVVR